MGIRERQKLMMNKAALSITKWIGSPESLILHTLLFIGSFLASKYGVVSWEKMLLLLTTLVSLEAIYLSIFIQMTLNLNNQQIEYIQEDLEEIQKDVEEIQEDVEEISEDVEEISEDVEEIQEIRTDKNSPTQESALLMSIQATLVQLQKEVEQLKSSYKK
jgi:biopolymer transport protein ExbB/TolQ